MAKYTLVLVRHGESTWNQQNLFTGWCDCDLSEKGIKEAKDAGKMLKENGYDFDIAFTSLLKRTIKTLYFIQDELDNHWIPVQRHWRLNERHYGCLQGLNKDETEVKYGEAQTKIWRRSYHVPPPPMDENDHKHAANDPKYALLDKQSVPSCESLHDTTLRLVPYWNDVIVPCMKSGQRVLVLSHGNCLKALVKYLDNISNEEIAYFNVPTGVPLIYELDENLRPLKRFYLTHKEVNRSETGHLARTGQCE